VSLKLETLQRTFSYKVRGALNAVLRLAEAGSLPAALVTASAGNHGRALGDAARLAGLPLTVYVPTAAPRVKLDALARTGARVVPCTDYDEAERRAKEAGARGHALYVSPYSHPDVIAGAGTVGLEILEEAPGIDAVVAAVGGGGLISGLAIAVEGRAAAFGVEADAPCPFTRSLAAGRVGPIDVRPTLADGLAGNLDPDTITFEVVRTRVAEIVTVSEEEIREAVAGLFSEERLIAEGAAGVAVAGVLARRLDLRGRRIAVVLSGANIDAGTLGRIIESRPGAPHRIQ
jgi:threonine dehydratase